MLLVLLPLLAPAQALEATAYEIDTTEKFVSFRLDSARNRLLKVDVLAGILASIFGAGAFVASVFGMNFKTPIFDEKEPYGIHEGTLFNVTIVTLGIFVVLSFVGLYMFLFSTGGWWRCCGGRANADRRSKYLDSMLGR